MKYVSLLLLFISSCATTVPLSPKSPINYGNRVQNDY